MRLQNTIRRNKSKDQRQCEYFPKVRHVNIRRNLKNLDFIGKKYFLHSSRPIEKNKNKFRWHYAEPLSQFAKRHSSMIRIV